MKRSKIAQITLFVILALILLFVVGIGIYFISNIKEEKIKIVSEKVQEVSLEVQTIKTFTDECIKKVAIESAYEFGLKQGYYEIPELFIDTNFLKIAYYYYKDKKLIPTISIFEKEFGKIIEENLLIDCTDFSIFKKLGFNIEFDEINTTTKILNDKVIIDVNYPLSIKKDNSLNTISKFTYTLLFRIGHIIDVSKELVKSVETEPYALDLTLLLNFDVDISVIHYDNCNDVYIIVDNESKIKPSDDDYVFTFAVGLENQYCKVNASYQETKLVIPYPTIENHEPILEPIPYLFADINKEFTYKLNAFDEDNDTLFYLTDGVLKNYTNVLTGLIKFIPIENQTGIHFINATVVDIKSGIDNKQFYLEIK